MFSAVLRRGNTYFFDDKDENIHPFRGTMHCTFKPFILTILFASHRTNTEDVSFFVPSNQTNQPQTDPTCRTPECHGESLSLPCFRDMTRLGHLAPPGTGINAKQISCSSRDPFLGWGDVGSLTNPDLDVQPEMCPHYNCMMYDASYHVEQLAKFDYINWTIYIIRFCGARISHVNVNSKCIFRFVWGYAGRDYERQRSQCLQGGGTSWSSPFCVNCTTDVRLSMFVWI